MKRNESKWSCSMCTFENYQASTKCSICLHPRGSEVIQFPPVSSEKPLVIHDIESTSTNSNSYSDFIICPPSCSSKPDVRNLNIAASNHFNQANTIAKLHKDESIVSPLSSNKQWSCAVCTFNNAEVNTSCTQCGSHKSKNSDDDESQNACFSKSENKKSKKWLCNVCTYENWSASKKCVMCHNKKGELLGNIVKNTGEKQLPKNFNENALVATSSSAVSDQSPVQNKVNIKKQKNLKTLENNLKLKNSENLSRCMDMNVSKDFNKHKSRSPSLSSSSSYSSDDAKTITPIQHRYNRQRSKKLNQVSKMVVGYVYCL